MPNPTHIFEVVDQTDEERYYTIGLFLTEQEAMSALEANEPPCDDNGEDAVTVEVRSRQIGWHPHDYKTVASRTWERDYADESDEKWKAHPIKLTPRT